MDRRTGRCGCPHPSKLTPHTPQYPKKNQSCNKNRPIRSHSIFFEKETPAPFFAVFFWLPKQLQVTNFWANDPSFSGSRSSTHLVPLHQSQPPVPRNGYQKMIGALENVSLNYEAIFFSVSIHPRKLTWNLKLMVSNRDLLF